MPARIRILVHAGASTSRQQDEQSRAQARAYLSLESTSSSRTSLNSNVRISTSSSQRDRASTTERSEDSSKRQHVSVFDRNVFIGDTQLAFAALESQFFTSVVPASERKSSPSDRIVHSSQLATNPASTSDSSHLRTSFRTQQQLHERLSCENSFQDLSGLELRQQHLISGCLESIGPSSQLPSTYSLTDSQDPNNSSDQKQLSDIQNSHVLVSRESGVSHASRSLQRLLCEKDALGSPDQPMESQETSLAGPVQLETNVRDATHIPVPDMDRVSMAHNLPTSIRPLAPEISMAPFVTHVTETLLHLVSNASLSNSYNPVSISRDLDPLERGCWLVSCVGWPENTRQDFWQMLQTVVGSGRAGWGVWCQRGVEERLDFTRRPSSVPLASDTESFGPVKVYCWGEVVKHIYLLLYVASNSKVRRHGLQWIDAEGMVVVQMRTAAKP